jgi:hypothetical protein
VRHEAWGTPESTPRISTYTTNPGSWRCPRARRRMRFLEAVRCGPACPVPSARARGGWRWLLIPVAIPVTSRVGAGAHQPLASAEGRRSCAGRPLDADGWPPATGSHDHDEPSQTGHQVSQPPGRKHSGSAPLDGRTASGGMSIRRWLSSSAPKSALFCRLPFTEPGPASCTQRNLCS